MKKLTAILLIISLNATSQEVRDPGFTQKNPEWKYEKMYQPVLTVTMPEYKGWDSVGHITTVSDTVKVLMLVCDTSYGLQPNGSIKAVYYKESKRFIYEPDSSYGKPNYKVWYEWGYEVKEIEDNVWTPFGKSYYDNRQYLDDKKQKLKPSIIVWQSIQIK